jgi:hypothetical protein
MPVATFDNNLENIRVEQLDIKKGELNGDWVKGGPLQEFSSTGILDKASDISLTVMDNLIVVDTIKTKTLVGDINLQGKLSVEKDVYIKGSLEVDKLQTKELISDKKVPGQYIEFGATNVRNSHLGTGFLWLGGKYSKQFILKAKPDRFFSTENIDLHTDASYMINGLEVLEKDKLGEGITRSSLREVGQLKNLKVTGRVELGEHFFYDPNLDRIGLGTDKPAGDIGIFNFANDTNVIIDAEDGDAKIGTYNNKNLRIITDDQARIKVSFKGDVTIGQEGNTSNTHRVYGKLGVGVKNPTEDLEVAGNIRFQNRLFMVADKPPTSGHWNKGDTVWNENPKNTAPVGWICTASGTPGNWSPWGFIGNNTIT